MLRKTLATCLFAALFAALLAGCAGNTHRQRPGSAFGQGLVPFGVQAANLVDQDDRSRLWVIVDVPRRGLQFERNEDKFIARFDVTVALRDQNGHALQLVDAARVLEVETYDQTQPESLFVRVASFMDAPPGTYTLETMVTDIISQGRGVSSKQVEIRDLNQPGLKLSDILLLDGASRGLPPEDLIIPSFRQRFNDTVYAFVQARNINVGQRLRAVLKIGGADGAQITHASLDTVATTEKVHLFFPIPPTKLGLGRLQLTMEVASQNETAEASRSMLVRWAPRPAPSVRQAFNDYVAPMRLIMNNKQWNELKNASPEGQRSLLTAFWNERNPAPEASSNLLEEEFYWRVGEANARYSWGRMHGWESDRGRVYIVHGPPDNIAQRFDQRYGRSIEIWRYEDPAREFVFYDEHGDGRYLLIRQTHAS